MSNANKSEWQMDRLVLGFCRRVMPPLQRVPIGGTGGVVPWSPGRRPRPLRPAGGATAPGTAHRPARPTGPTGPTNGRIPGLTGTARSCRSAAGSPSSPTLEGSSGQRDRPTTRRVGVRWSRVVGDLHPAARPTPGDLGCIGPEGQIWSEPVAFRLGSRGKRRRSATGVGASSTIWPQRWHSQRRAGGYASAHQSCEVK